MLLNPNNPKLVCSRRSFFRRYKLFLTTDVLSTAEDQGIAVGKPQYVADKSIKLLNADIDQTVGLAKKNSKLSENVMIFKEQVATECGVFNKVRSPSNETTKFYQLLSVQNDDNVHLVKTGSTRAKISVYKQLPHP